MEIDEVIVDSGLWAKAQARDKAAVKELRAQLDGLVLYLHGLGGVEGEVVTLRELEAASVVDSVVIRNDHRHHEWLERE